MPFGLKNVPASFQRTINLALLGLLRNEALVYLDGIIIVASSLKEHEKKIQRVFNRHITSKLSLQPDKCDFLTTEIEYLGHVI